MPMSKDAKRIADKFADAIAAIANGSPEAARQAAAFIRSPAFDADTDDARRSAINAFAYFIEQTATKRERAYRATYKGDQ